MSSITYITNISILIYIKVDILFRVSRGSDPNHFNTNKSKVTKTWGEHLRESDNKKLQDRANKRANRLARKNEKKQFKKDVDDYEKAKQYSVGSPYFIR